ncbi:hypothetical protein KM043_016106 [Ampulex compressa]|nr:hypothetical protein KM043_016106 [Ampulex compressa]
MSQGVGWIYRRPNRELRAIAEQQGLDPKGGVEQLQSRLSHHVRMERMERPSTLNLPEANPTAINKARRRGVHFDGRELKEFLESLEKLHIGYRVSPADALTCLEKMIRGPARVWYQNQRSRWSKCEDFLAAFRNRYILPTRAEELEGEIERRIQRPGESVRAYADSL